MDRNTIYGVGLIFLIIIGFTMITSPSKEELELARLNAQRSRDSLAMVEKIQKDSANFIKNNQVLNETVSVTNSAEKDSIKQLEASDKFGAFASVSKGEEKYITLENDKVKLKIATKGGRIYSVALKEFKKWDSSQVVLFDGDNNKFDFNFFAQNKNIQTGDLFFTAETKEEAIVVKDKKGSVSMRLKVNGDQYIEYLYTLEPNSYMVSFKVNFVGMSGIIANNNKYIDLKWVTDIPHQEKGLDWENQNTTIYYKYAGEDEDVDYLTETAETDEEKLPANVKWIAYKQQFFSTVLIADVAMDQANISHKQLWKTDPRYLKNFNSAISFPYKGAGNESLGMSFFFGPNQYNLLKEIKPEEELKLQKMIPLGWGIFGWVNRFMIIPMFDLLGSFIGNYGLIILLMTIVIKLVLLPLTYKSYLSTARMKVLKPEIEEINKKISKDKPMERQQATMAMYRKAGVNPLGGCLPMLLQMPILIAMFRFFPASIELRQKAFLWAEDLSTFDSIFNLPFTIPFYGDHVSLFTLLMGASMYLASRSGSSDFGSTDNSQASAMKIMTYLMPFMLVIWFNSYSSGLSYYYFLSNMISFIQMIIIKRYVNEDDLLKKIHERKNKPVEKSKFQKKLEDLAKQRGVKLPKK